MVKAIIFDFDGVICDSVDVKTLAFAEMYAGFGNEIENKVIQYHLEHGGISRYEKFRFFHSEFLGIELNDPELNAMGEQFSSIAFQKVINSPFIKGAGEFIRTNSKKYLQFICTGTPENEIKTILAKKEMKQFFNEVYGSPQTKKVIIKNILQKYELLPEEIVFIGDAMTDFNAASGTNIRFIGVKSSHTQFPEGTFVIDDFTDPKLKKFSI